MTDFSFNRNLAMDLFSILLQFSHWVNSQFSTIWPVTDYSLYYHLPIVLFSILVKGFHSDLAVLSHCLQKTSGGIIWRIWRKFLHFVLTKWRKFITLYNLYLYNTTYNYQFFTVSDFPYLSNVAIIWLFICVEFVHWVILNFFTSWPLSDLPF